jgi:hypothetical protein
MGKAIPTQHPAVVLRSHYQQLRALLAILMIAVVGLTVTVVILASDNDSVSVGGETSVAPIPRINYGGFNPATGRPDAAPLPQADATALPQRRLDGATDSTRYDGGPEEGTRGIAPAAPPTTRSDGGPEEGSHGLTGKSYSENSATGDTSPAQP